MAAGATVTCRGARWWQVSACLEANTVNSCRGKCLLEINTVVYRCRGKCLLEINIGYHCRGKCLLEINTVYRSRGRCLLETKLFMAVGGSVCLRLNCLWL